MNSPGVEDGHRAGRVTGTAAHPSGARLTMPSLRDVAISTALAKSADTVDMVAQERWAFTLSNGTKIAARAHIDDGWLLFDAPLGLELTPPAPEEMLWDLLRANATFRGGARFVWLPNDAALRVRADLPLDEDVDLHQRVPQVCAGLKAAAEHVQARTTTRKAPESDATDAAPEVTRAGGVENAGAMTHGVILGRCRDSGWTVGEREPGRLVVDLDVPGAFEQAFVETRSDLSVVVSVPVLETAAPDAESRPLVCRQAFGLLLLRVTGLMRMARVALDKRDEASARFEVVFEIEPSAAELAHAFSALSVASQVAGREAAMLWSDEVVAQAYVEEWQHGRGSDGRDRGDRRSARRPRRPDAMAMWDTASESTKSTMGVVAPG